MIILKNIFFIKTIQVNTIETYLGDKLNNIISVSINSQKIISPWTDPNNNLLPTILIHIYKYYNH